MHPSADTSVCATFSIKKGEKKKILGEVADSVLGEVPGKLGHLVPASREASKKNRVLSKGCWRGRV